MNFNRNLLSNAVRCGLVVGAAGVLGMTAAPAFAQDETARLDRIEVTGSRIKRADVEGALPVTVIDRQQIELSGDTSVADFLRNTTFNSFGSIRPQSGSSAQSFAGLSLRGLGSGRTLILIDGRRAPVAPQVGNAQDLNSIPLAAVERIEILSDGASAIYGTDAIGGVVNIITRKDFNGVQITGGFSSPKRPGGETEEGSIIFGTSSDRGSMLAGVSYNNRGIVFQRERSWSTGGASVFSNNFRVANPAAGSLYGFVVGGFIGGGAAVPGGCSEPGFSIAPNGNCVYDFTSSAADEAEIRASSLFTRASYQINDTWTTYLNASLSRVESFGRYAPVPSSPWPGGAPFIPVGSPNHPAVRFPNDARYDANRPYFLAHRFAALGPRDTSTDANTYMIDWGFDATLGRFDVNFGMRRVESQYYDLGRNYVVGGIAQQLIASGAYNIYSPSSNPRSILNSMIATINRDGRTTNNELYALGSTEMFEMAGGMAGIAVGMEYREESYQDIYDTLQSSNQIVGSAGNSAFGDRDVTSLFAEALFPVLSTLEIGLAARHDRYSDYGSDTSPKVSLRWNPLETLVLRASYGEGFRAPDLRTVSLQPSFGAANTNDPATCQAFTGNPVCQTQVTTYTIANPNLVSEQSEQFSIGVVWDATDWLNLSLDYYDITVTNRIAGIGLQQIINCLAGTSANCPAGLSVLPTNVSPPQVGLGLGVARVPGSGEILYAQLGSTNLGTLDTSGMDLNVRTNFDLGAMGGLRNELQVGYVRDYRVDGGRNIIGEPGVPKYRAGLRHSWVYGDFSFAWNTSYIHSTFTVAGLTTGAEQSSWTTHDLQASWNAPWNGRVTFGVTNLADKDPPLDPAYGRGYDEQLYDGYGRVPYFRYTQSF
jgi:iron complex outermembrane recepter protein